MRSYGAASSGPGGLAREALHLARGRSDITGQIGAALERLRELDSLAANELGLTLAGLTLLDVGAGQLPTQTAYFALRNDVTGIDLDVIANGFDPRRYVEMLRKNGSKRLAKTLARKALLLDVRYRRELARQLGVDSLPPVQVIQMDAAQMSFPGGTFDFAYSLAVFQHLERPADVLDEIVRVLKPGGSLYLDFILFTSRTGSHDVRLLSGGDGELPLWAHLRPQFQPLVRPNAYVNGIRLPEWATLLGERLPGFKLILKQPEAKQLEPKARLLWEQNELTDYGLDELVTTKVAVLWSKSATAATSRAPGAR
jgi:SAM-dependent methyltransferase